MALSNTAYRIKMLIALTLKKSLPIEIITITPAENDAVTGHLRKFFLFREFSLCIGCPRNNRHDASYS